MHQHQQQAVHWAGRGASMPQCPAIVVVSERWDEMQCSQAAACTYTVFIDCSLSSDAVRPTNATL